MSHCTSVIGLPHQDVGENLFAISRPGLLYLFNSQEPEPGKIDQASTDHSGAE